MKNTERLTPRDFAKKYDLANLQADTFYELYYLDFQYQSRRRELMRDLEKGKGIGRILKFQAADLMEYEFYHDEYRGLLAYMDRANGETFTDESFSVALGDLQDDATRRLDLAQFASGNGGMTQQQYLAENKALINLLKICRKYFTEEK